MLDEADRMLDMGFIRDIRKIVAKLPAQRQTLMFSATMPEDIAELGRQMLKDPAKVSVTPQATTVERIAQRIIHVDRGSKPKMLSDIIQQEKVDRVLVFTRTKHGADKVVRGLNKDGIAAEAIHGNKSQNQRERVLKDFRDGRVRRWWRPTSPPAASTSRASATSSTSICPTSRKATCTASAAPRAPAPTASPSRSARTTSCRSCATSRS